MTVRGGNRTREKYTGNKRNWLMGNLESNAVRGESFPVVSEHVIFYNLDA